jgi:phage shock protein PspC (stress-responsive transcriptional regulator)
MNKVVTINLNGNAYQLEEQGYEALRAYLETANARLQGDPDRAEIVSDIEQAIADKCRRHLNPHKSVVTLAAIEKILEEMGPVDAAADAPDANPAASRQDAGDTPPPRRLYQIREGAMISGVCNGLAAYFNVDVTIVRIGAVLAAVLTGGIWIFAYIVAMFVIPFANTSEERAAARGQPFNAQELVDRAKQQYAELREQGSKWQDNWRRRREARRERRAAAAERAYWQSARAQQDVGYATRVLAGFMVPVFTILSAALFVVVVLAGWSIFMTGGIFDWTLPHQVPTWAAIVVLVILHQALHAPLRAASRASYETTAGPRYGWLAAADAVLWLGFTALLFWLAWLFVPEVQSLFEDMPYEWRHLTAAWHGL